MICKGTGDWGLGEQKNRGQGIKSGEPRAHRFFLFSPERAGGLFLLLFAGGVDGQGAVLAGELDAGAVELLLDLGRVAGIEVAG